MGSRTEHLELKLLAAPHHVEVNTKKYIFTTPKRAAFYNIQRRTSKIYKTVRALTVQARKPQDDG